jgi:hypothetical protein
MYKLNKVISLRNRVLNSKYMLNLTKSRFSEDLTLPIIDFQKFLNKSEGWEKECKITAECLHDTGVLCVKDPVKIF